MITFHPPCPHPPIKLKNSHGSKNLRYHSTSVHTRILHDMVIWQPPQNFSPEYTQIMQAESWVTVAVQRVSFIKEASPPAQNREMKLQQCNWKRRPTLQNLCFLKRLLVTTPFYFSLYARLQIFCLRTTKITMFRRRLTDTPEPWGHCLRTWMNPSLR